MTKAIVWTNLGCHFCEMAKTLLKQKGIETTLLARQEGMPLQVKVKKQ